MAGVLALGAGVAQAWLVHPLAWLPTALFGGDEAFQLGCIQSILDSRNPMASCSTCGALPGYLPLYGTLVALFSGLCREPVLQSMLLLSVAFRVVSVLIVFAVFARLFGRSVGVVMAALWAVLHPDLLVKYTEFAGAILVPIYFYALLRFIEEPRLGRSVCLGLVLAAAGYAHAVVFMGGIVIAGVTAVLGAVWRGRPGRVGRELVASLGGLGVVGALTLLALGYWYRPIFVYHGSTSLHYTEWNGGVALETLGYRLAYAAQVLQRFVRLDDVPMAVVNVLFFAGCVAFWRGTERRRFVPGVLMAVATFAWEFHFFLTIPLLHTHFIPEYVRRYLWVFAIQFVAVIPVVLFLERIRSRTAALAFNCSVGVMALVGLTLETTAVARTPFMVSARSPVDRKYVALQAAVRRYTRPDDVFLSTNELSFALSALTGRKVLVTRRAQNDAFIDMDERNRDAALILYGRDQPLRRRLLARWSVRYLLWTDDWIPMEYEPGVEGEPLHGIPARTGASRRGAGPGLPPGLAALPADPLLLFYNAADEAELDRAGVATRTIHTWVDPALQGPEYPKFDLLFVLPENYERPDHPWRDELDSLLTEVWSCSYGTRKVAAVFRIKS